MGWSVGHRISVVTQPIRHGSSVPTVGFITLLEEAAAELIRAKSNRRRRLTTDPLGLDKDKSKQNGMMDRYTKDLMACANILRHGMEEGTIGTNVHLENLRDEKEWNDRVRVHSRHPPLQSAMDGRLSANHSRL